MFIHIMVIKIAHQVSEIISHTAVKSVRFSFVTAILNFWRMSTSRDTGSDAIKKLDPDNMGIAVGILLLCALELDTCICLG